MAARHRGKALIGCVHEHRLVIARSAPRDAAGKPILAATVNDQTVIAVDIYVYVYGANANITTENAFDLATLSLTLEFSVAK